MISQLAFTQLGKGRSKTTDQVCTFLPRPPPPLNLCQREPSYNWLLPRILLRGKAPVLSATGLYQDSILRAAVCTEVTCSPERTILAFLFPSIFMVLIKAGHWRFGDGLGKPVEHLSATEGWYRSKIMVTTELHNQLDSDQDILWLHMPGTLGIFLGNQDLSGNSRRDSLLPF